ncbi:ribonuclease E [Desmospora sp. 8437]|nr:ribonuclease E [Desmospora sp. 8437]
MSVRYPRSSPSERRRPIHEKTTGPGIPFQSTGSQTLGLVKNQDGTAGGALASATAPTAPTAFLPSAPGSGTTWICQPGTAPRPRWRIRRSRMGCALRVSPRPEGGAPRRPDERGPRDGRDSRLDEWWGGPMMDWGRPQDREMPPWAQPPRDRSREGEIPSWDQAPRYRDGDREGEVPSWNGSPRDREGEAPYWGRSPRDREEAPAMDRSPRQREGGREDPADRRLEGGERRGERPRRRSPRRDWEELPSLFDETEHVTSSGIRRRRSRSTRKRRY